MAKITHYLKKRIGKEVHSFSVEGDNLHEVVMAGLKLSFGDVDVCGKCGSDDLMLTAHVAKNKFKYTLVKCKKCKSYVNMGNQQENPDIFYLRTKEDKKTLDWRDSTSPMVDE